MHIVHMDYHRSTTHEAPAIPAYSLIAVLIALELLEVHGPDGQVAFVNVHEIAAIRAPTATDLGRHFAKGSKCIVLTTDGKFLAVTETCGELRALLSGR